MEIRYVKWDSFEPHPLKFKKKHYKSEYETATQFVAMDTETSKLYLENISAYRAWIYQWCFSYPLPEGEGIQLVYGRRPSEMMTCLSKIKRVNRLSDKRLLHIVIHNLSYDYQYIKDWLRKYFADRGEIIAIDMHKLITFRLDGFLFKCTYRLSQKSLASWGKDNNIKHPKLVGEIDYDVLRFQDSPLVRKDWRYMFRDVIALHECFDTQLSLHGDTVMSVPLTNTGYVRRECRKRFKALRKNSTDFIENRMDDRVYKLINMENAGGLTHGNRFKAGEIVTIKDEDKEKGICIRHRDFASHYPSQQRTRQAPINAFHQWYNRFEAEKLGTKVWGIDDLEALDEKMEWLAVIEIREARVHKGITLPYLQTHKCIEGSVKSRRKYWHTDTEFMGNKKLGDKKHDENYYTSNNFDKLIDDNGRVLYLYGKCYVGVNRYDLKWILKQYDIDYDIVLVYSAKRGPFPQYIQDTVDYFFVEKTRTKWKLKKMEDEGVPPTDPAYIKAKQDNSIAKAMLNAIFGMTDTNPVRLSYWEDENGKWQKNLLTDEYIVKKLDEYYSSKNSFMELKFGAWTTACARDELMEFVELIGYENFLYADTDSIFYISTPEIEERIEARNAELRREGDEKGWYVDIDGKRVYYRQFEPEKEVIYQFKFLHSKCYAYVLDNGKMKATIAGVAEYSKDHKVTRVQELGTLDNLKHGFTFTACGGTTCEYIEHPPVKGYIDGHLTEYASCAIIMPTEKTLKEITETPFWWSKADI